jgi:hypothetical protein
MIRPPPLSFMTHAACNIRKRASTLTANTLSHSSLVASKSDWTDETAALFTRSSSRPNRRVYGRPSKTPP